MFQQLRCEAMKAWLQGREGKKGTWAVGGRAGGGLVG